MGAATFYKYTTQNLKFSYFCPRLSTTSTYIEYQCILCIHLKLTLEIPTVMQFFLHNVLYTY